MKEELSKNFSLSEFLISSTRPDMAKQMKVSDKEYENIKKLVIEILQPIRDTLNENITISSGFRCEKLNKAIGGSASSDHMYAMAADIVSKQIRENPEKVARMIWSKNIKSIRQLIVYPNNKFIHVSVNTPLKPYKHEFLKSINNKIERLA